MFEQSVISENVFLRHVCALREDARTCIDGAGAAELRRGDNDTAIDLLQTVLAAEIACVLRYTMISVSPDGLRSPWISGEFQAQANDERTHMKMAAERIEQLGGTPNFNPGCLPPRPVALINADASFARCVEENLAAERCVIEHYEDLIQYFSTNDPETCSMLREIVRDEEDHTSDMEDLLVSYRG